METTPLELDAELILGIDPGTCVVGYGAVRARGAAKGRTPALLRAELVEAGILRTKRARPLPERLGLLMRYLEDLIFELRPGVVVIERAFTGRNPLTALRLGEGRGLAIAIAARHGCRVVERTPAEAKRLVAGSGAASKSIVAAAVQSLLRVPLDGSPLDATDALALALSELHRPARARAAGPGPEPVATPAPRLRLPNAGALRGSARPPQSGADLRAGADPRTSPTGTPGGGELGV